MEQILLEELLDVWDILLAVAVLFISLTLLSVVLLGITFVFRLDTTQIHIAPDSKGIDSTAYCVRISSTTIVLLASYCSTIPKIIAGYFMVLRYYPSSQQNLKLSDAANRVELPTPFQVALVVAILSGGIDALRRWIKYVFGWKNRSRVWKVERNSVWGVALTTAMMHVADFPPSFCRAPIFLADS
jgi:hypothetical protein